MKLGDGLFLDAHAEGRRATHTDITYDERIVDAACMQLVMSPEKFDVLRAAEPLRRHRVGSRAPASSAGSASCPGRTSASTCAVFEAVHGSAPDIADKNLANPTALLLSGLMMLDHIGERDAAGASGRRSSRVLTDGRRPHARPRRHGVDDGVHRRDLRAVESLLDLTQHCPLSVSGGAFP